MYRLLILSGIILFGQYNSQRSIKLPIRQSLFTLCGAGYQKLSNEEKLFLKDIKINGVNGHEWKASQPDADVEISSFGWQKYTYLIENQPNGKIWRFDFSNINWRVIVTLPFNMQA